MSAHPEIEQAVRTVEENKHWLYKQCPEELERAILDLVSFVKWKLEMPIGDKS